jgi:hypothetical protein
VGRFIRYWYTYRTFVAVLLGILISGACYWLYLEQMAGDAGQSVALNISVHPEDRIMSAIGPYVTDPNIEIVGIDDQSMIGRSWPLPRDDYATALKNLEAAGAAVVAFDIEFHDSSESDATFAAALKNASIPVILGYGGSQTQAADGMYVQKGVDQLPLKKFWCADPALPQRRASSHTRTLASARPTPPQTRTACCVGSRCSSSRHAWRSLPATPRC